MARASGITRIFYNPSAANWDARSFAIYMRNSQVAELQTMINTTTLKGRNLVQLENVLETRNVRSLVRRRYPGGPAISVDAGTRRVITGPSARLQAYPGRPITLERVKAGGNIQDAPANAKLDVLQITIEGSFPFFHEFCKSASVIGFILRTNHGRPLLIAPPSGG